MKFVGSLVCVVVLFTQLYAEGELNDRPHAVLIYGIRGSGRATMSVKLRKQFSFPDISLASLLANHVAEETSLGKKAKNYFSHGGELPPELSLEILSERISQPDCAKGFLLEEFPLTPLEAQALYDKFSSHVSFLVITVDVSDDWLIERFQHRSVCRTCGRVYDDETFSCPKHKGQCDICSGTLHQRTEDSPEVIKSRIASYRTVMSPIFDYYRQKNVLVHVSGDRDFEETYQEIVRTIEQRTGIAPNKLQAIENDNIDSLSSCSSEGHDK